MRALGTRTRAQRNVKENEDVIAQDAFFMLNAEWEAASVNNAAGNLRTSPPF